MTQRVLVTGANGFVGTELCSTLADAGYLVRAALRARPESWGDRFEPVVIGNLNGETDWSQALRDVDIVFHLAARAHILDDPPGSAYLYMQTNADATRRLAEMAARAGTRRFVFMSSVKVNGEISGNNPFSPADEPRPSDAYGRSKALAEQYLHAVAAQTGMEAVCIRPPLVYGTGVRANFLRLLHWVDRERLMPFGAINNRRSLVSIWNLCHLLVHVARHPVSARGTWMVSDAEDLSTPELIQRIANAMNRRVRLIRVPEILLLGAGMLLHKRNQVARLCGSLAVDVSRTRRDLGWTPPLSVNEGLARTVDSYLKGRARRGT